MGGIGAPFTDDSMLPFGQSFEDSLNMDGSGDSSSIQQNAFSQFQNSSFELIDKPKHVNKLNISFATVSKKKKNRLYFVNLV